MAVESEVYKFGAFVLNIDEHKIYENNVELTLGDVPFRLLTLLVRNARKPVSCKSIMQEVWNKQKINKNNIEVQIRILRNLFDDKHKNPEFIATVSGGYMFIGRLEGDHVIYYNFRLKKPFDVVFGRGDVRKQIQDRCFKKAEQVDMLGVTLYTQWFSRRAFRDIMIERLDNKDLALRVLMPRKESPFLKQFTTEWAYKHRHREKEVFERERMRFYEEYDGTIKFLQEYAEEENLRYLKDETVCCGIVRVDNLMVIGVSTFPHAGGQHAHIILCRNQKPEPPEEKHANLLFDNYKRTFVTLWNEFGRQPDEIEE